jgi:hypothetical protein
MSKLYSFAESVEMFAQRLIPMYHPELATARIKYLFVDKASMKGGRPVSGKVRKVTGALEYLLECDFLVEVALDQWNEKSAEQRQALIDHLLERCTGEEDEKTGDMNWTTREPDVTEFTAILRRHGAWNDDLAGFASVAKTVDIDSMVEDVVASSAVEGVAASV